MYLYEPHNMLISGVTNCGKTHFVLDLLDNEYKDYFDYIVVFCPTFYTNKTYENRKCVNGKKCIVLNPDAVKNDLDTCLKIATNTYKNSNTLFLIDDCANLNDMKKKKSELCFLAFSGRHLGITVWVINQKYNSVVKDFRENIRFLVLFFNKDEKAMKQALEENGIIPKDERNDYIEALKENKGSKLLLRLQHPYKANLSYVEKTLFFSSIKNVNPQLVSIH